MAGEVVPINKIASGEVKVPREALERLGRKLKDKFGTYSTNRRGAELQWVKNLRQYLGKYDPEYEAKLPKNRSRAYPRITRVKVVGMVARLMSLLFPAGESNWSLVASPDPDLNAEQLAEVLQEWATENPDAEVNQDDLDAYVRAFAQRRASNMERVITDQLSDTAVYGAEDYVALVRMVVQSAVLYSVGVLRGPMAIAQTKSRAVVNPETGVPEVVTEETYRPAFEFVNIWDYYPDLSARTFKDMEGEFHRRVYNKHQLMELAGRDDYFGDVIREYVRDNQDGDYAKTTFEADIEALSVDDGQAKRLAGKYEVVEYWGHVSGRDLAAVGVEIDDKDIDTTMVATVTMLGTKVIKAQRDPFPRGTRMYHQFVFEQDEANLCGSGMPPIMRDSQLAICSAARMLIDNASVAAGPSVEVDLSLVHENQDVSGIQPFSVYYKKMTAPANSGRLVQSVSVDSHIDELLKVLDRFMSLADLETFVGPQTGGEFENAPSEPMRTAAGASMILGTTALPFRDIVRNFDRFTISVIDALVEWNHLFNNQPRLVGDVRPIGKGATTLIAKEVRALALDNLATTMREDEAVHINPRELAKHRLMVRDLPHDQLMVTEAEANKRIEAQEQAAQAAQDLQNRLVEGQIKEIAAGTYKAMTQAQKNLDSGDTSVFDSVAKALSSGVNPYEIIQFIQSNPGEVAPNPQLPGGAGVSGVPAAAPPGIGGPNVGGVG